MRGANVGTSISRRAAALMLLALGGCVGPQASIHYVGPNGAYGMGTIEANPAGQLSGKITLSNSLETCTSTFENWHSPTISTPFSCSDGKSGTLTLTRASPSLEGQGTAQFTDGTNRLVIFNVKAGPSLVGGLAAIGAKDGPPSRQ
jgi:hypothetical protein